MRKTILFLLGLLVFLHNLNAQTWFQSGQSADLMVSGVDFNNTGGAMQWNHPNGLATDGVRFLLCDRFNNRILVWNDLPSSWDAAPDLVLGQPDFISNNPGNGKNQMNWVGNVSLGANGKVAAADTENDRILLWNTFPTQNGQAADVSLFLPAFTPSGQSVPYGWPWGVWTDGQRLAAVATGGGALLFWNSFPGADNTPPDYAIQLPQFGTPRNISTDGSSYFFVGDHNAKVNGVPGTFFWNTYPTAPNQPYDFYRDEWIKGEKTPDGKLIAAGIQSLYVWNSVPVNASQSPDLTLKPSMYKNGDGVDLAFAGGRLYANNYNGNNVLVFNGIPASGGQLPDFAIGSESIYAQTLDSIYYVQNPVLVTDGTRLIAGSDFDRAWYIWDQFPTHSGQPYDHRIALPPNVPLWAAALHNNTLVAGARNTISIWDDAGQISATPSRAFNNNIGSATLNDIVGVALDDHLFYVATRSGKLYVWKGIPADNSAQPFLTLNSSSGSQFSYLSSDGVYFCAARPEPPTGVDIYKVADLVNGNTTPYKIINSGQQRINQASQAVTFNGSLAISSRGDHIVLLWEKEQDWGNAQKTVALGQPNAQGHDAAIGLDRLFMPSALLPLKNELWVGEFKFSSRILKFSYGNPTATGEPTATTTLRAEIFPNPSAGGFQLTFEAPAAGEYRIDLLDVTGRICATPWQRVVSTPQTVEQVGSTDALPAGLYFLRIQGPGLHHVLRWVRE